MNYGLIMELDELKNETSGSCCRHGRNDKCTQYFGQKT
jgi:hypothetical protein